MGINMSHVRTSLELPVKPKFYSVKFLWQLKLLDVYQEYVNQIKSEIPAWYELISEKVKGLELSEPGVDIDNSLQIALKMRNNLRVLLNILDSAQDKIDGVIYSGLRHNDSRSRFD
jgi:hypothetical protein